MKEEVILFTSADEMNTLFRARSILLIAINNQRYCVTKNENEIVVFESKCPHNNYPLAEGIINRQGQLVCPRHAYKFNLKSGVESDNRCRSIKLAKAYQTSSGAIAVFL